MNEDISRQIEVYKTRYDTEIEKWTELRAKYEREMLEADDTIKVYRGLLKQIKEDEALLNGRDNNKG